MDPVESTQKQMSMKPKAGIGRLSFDFVLKTVALVGLRDLSMLLARMMVGAVLAGGTAGSTGAMAGADGTAGLLGRVALLCIFDATTGLAAFLLFLFLASIDFPYSMVLAIVLVLVIFFSLLFLRYS